MAVLIAMLRGVNVGGKQIVNMESLRNLCVGLGLKDVQSYIQSGNLVFRGKGGDARGLGRKLETALEKMLGFRPGVVMRTTTELRRVVDRNPFAARPGIEPNRLLVLFLADPSTPAARDQVRAMPCEPEEIVVMESELYIYYPDGMARPKVPMARIEKVLQCVSTGRNWNTVHKLLAMAEALESASG